MNEQERITDDTDPMFDTGKAAREAVRLCRLLWEDRQAEKQQEQKRRSFGVKLWIAFRNAVQKFAGDIRDLRIDE